MGPARRDTGFTMVELLVVMLIVGTLAGIAVPAFAGQKAKAQRAAMVSDLRSLVQAQATRAVDGADWTDSTAALRALGYVSSDGIPPATVELFTVDGTPHYLACVKHVGVDEWLTYDSSKGTDRYAPTCAAPASS